MEVVFCRTLQLLFGVQIKNAQKPKKNVQGKSCVLYLSAQGKSCVLYLSAQGKSCVLYLSAQGKSCVLYVSAHYLLVFCDSR